jgi:hypothetical protein
VKESLPRDADGSTKPAGNKIREGWKIVFHQGTIMQHPPGPNTANF